MNSSLNSENVIKFLIDWLRNPRPTKYSSYGYEIYLPNLMREYCMEIMGYQEPEPYLKEISPVFYDCAWELCRRGILRPGVTHYSAQATASGASGDGYSITPFGRQWVEEADKDSFVPIEPEQVGKLLAKFREVFGEGYHQRSQEAVRCYGAHAYLASCALSGAAAESILLYLAIDLNGDENEVLKMYSQRSGRKKVENLIYGKLHGSIQKEFKRFLDLLKYWRDESAHGKVSHISDLEAFTSIALLLRFSNFVHDNWKNWTN